MFRDTLIVKYQDAQPGKRRKKEMLRTTLLRGLACGIDCTTLVTPI